MARDIQAIIGFLDRYLEQSGRPTIDPGLASRILANEGFLNSNSSSPDKLLRHMLRQGKIPHAYQTGGKHTSWVIPHSRTSPRTKLHQPAAPAVHKPQVTTVPVMPGLAETTPSAITEEHAAQLMDTQGGQSVGEIDPFVPDKPGLYCLRVNEVDALPPAYARVLRERGHNIIYIGIATQSLKTRFLGQELRAKSHGTFFRSVGAMLGYRPPAGSLIGKANLNNYKFSRDDEGKIIQWMNLHLTARWIVFRGDFNALEHQLICKHLPLLNVQGNPDALKILEDDRRACRAVACGKATPA